MDCKAFKSIKEWKLEIINTKSKKVPPSDKVVSRQSSLQHNKQWYHSILILGLYFENEIEIKKSSSEELLEITDNINREAVTQ